MGYPKLVGTLIVCWKGFKKRHKLVIYFFQKFIFCWFSHTSVSHDNILFSWHINRNLYFSNNCLKISQELSDLNSFSSIEYYAVPSSFMDLQGAFTTHCSLIYTCVTKYCVVDDFSLNLFIYSCVANFQ